MEATSRLDSLAPLRRRPLHGRSAHTCVQSREIDFLTIVLDFFRFQISSNGCLRVLDSVSDNRFGRRTDGQGC